MAHQPYGPRASALRADGTALPACLAAAALIAAVLCLIPLPGKAANFTPPQGCRLEATAQNRSCTVIQYYRCDADPKGDQRSASFDQDGISNLARIDDQTRWMESSDPVTGLEDRLVEDSADHASFDTLIETGRDDFDFWTESNSGEKLRHVGHDELTGEMVSIDGIELEKTRFQLTTYSESGEVLIERSGQQFISHATRRFYGGVESQSDWTGQHLETNDSPVHFAFPGESGFGETTPQFDCDQLMTQLLQERAQL